MSAMDYDVGEIYNTLYVLVYEIECNNGDIGLLKTSEAFEDAKILIKDVEEDNE